MFQLLYHFFGIIWDVKFCLHIVLVLFAATAALGAGTPAKSVVAPATPPAKPANPPAKPSKSAETPKKPLIPASEWKMIRQIAVNYDLSDDATWLLAAIRRHENGRAGLEFGVGGPMDSGHPAHRYRDGVKSFYVQGYWAAGTIRKHYTGDLTAFGKRYNPPHAAKWTTAVTALIKRLKAENNSMLPGVKPEKKVISLP